MRKIAMIKLTTPAPAHTVYKQYPRYDWEKNELSLSNASIPSSTTYILIIIPTNDEHITLSNPSKRYTRLLLSHNYFVYRMTPSDCVYWRKMELDCMAFFSAHCRCVCVCALIHRWKEGLAKIVCIPFAINGLRCSWDFLSSSLIESIVTIHSSISTNIFQLKYSTIELVFA